MTRDEAKMLLPIIKAYADGEELQYHFYSDIDNKMIWLDVDGDIDFGNDGDKLRIKPKTEELTTVDTVKSESKKIATENDDNNSYEPFESLEECWGEMKKHQPFNWVKFKDNDDIGNYVQVVNVSDKCVYLADNINSPRHYITMCHYMEFIDGTPFGKLKKCRMENEKCAVPFGNNMLLQDKNGVLYDMQGNPYVDEKL